MGELFRLDPPDAQDAPRADAGHQGQPHAGRAGIRGGGRNPRDEADGALDHFIERDGIRFAGMHLIIDLWQAENLHDVEVVERALRDAVAAAGATLLGIDLHRFSPNGGISGVAVLAESHISIHTWPERAFAAVDVFMCGDAEPRKTIAVLRQAFAPGMLTVAEHKRGVIP